MNARQSRIWQLFIGLTGCGSVVLGAAAAHGIADPLAAIALERAALYGLIHAVALLALLNTSGRLALVARCLFATGILLFTGSITLKYLGGMMAVGQLAPVGGICLMLGWLGVIFTKWRG